MTHSSYITLVFIVLLLAMPASATIHISNPDMQFYTSGGAVISFAGDTTLDAMQWGGDYLNLTVNGSITSFSGSATDVMLSNLIYQPVPENLSFTMSAIAGILNMNTDMAYANVKYAMYVNGTEYDTEISDSSGKSQYSYSTWGGGKGVYFAPLAPEITSYNNSVTQDNYIYPHQNSNAGVIFNVTTDSPIDTWTWYVDGAAVSNNYGNLSYTWAKSGQKNVTVSGSNAVGSTTSLSWFPLIKRAKSDSSDETAALNTTWFDDLVASISDETPSLSGFASATVQPFTSLLGNLFYLFLYGLPLLVIWIRQEKAIIPAGLGIIFGAFFLGQLPESYIGVAVLFIILTVFGIIYSLYKERG